MDKNEYKKKTKVRLQIYNDNLHLNNKEIAELIQQQEPDTKLNTILQWVTRQRN